MLKLATTHLWLRHHDSVLARRFGSSDAATRRRIRAQPPQEERVPPLKTAFRKAVGFLDAGFELELAIADRCLTERGEVVGED